MIKHVAKDLLAVNVEHRNRMVALIFQKMFSQYFFETTTIVMPTVTDID